MGDGSRLTGVAAGDIVHVENALGRTDKTMILGRCSGRCGYYCLTHRATLANGHQLEAHLDTSPDHDHAIASMCARHGLEAFDPATVGATAGDGNLTLGLG